MNRRTSPSAPYRIPGVSVHPLRSSWNFTRCFCEPAYFSTISRSVVGVFPGADIPPATHIILHMYRFVEPGLFGAIGMRDRTCGSFPGGIYGVLRHDTPSQHSRLRLPPFVFQERTPPFDGPAPPYISPRSRRSSPDLRPLVPMKLFVPNGR